MPPGMISDSDFFNGEFANLAHLNVNFTITEAIAFFCETAQRIVDPARDGGIIIAQFVGIEFEFVKDIIDIRFAAH